VSLARAVRRAPSAAAVLWRLRRGRAAIASVNLLNRCNQACPMCSVHASPDHALALDELDTAFRALRAGGVRIVELSGGEPFLRRDLPEVVALADRAGLLFTFNTNATAISEAGLAALSGARGLLQVAVSLDSLDRERYARLRGRDLLPRALAGLERLQGAGRAAPLKLNVAVSRHNVAEVPTLLAFARERGLFLSAFPVNQGPGAHRSDSGAFAAEEAERAAIASTFEDLARRRRRGEPLWEPSSFYRAAARFIRGEPLAPCGAGRLYLDLRADGSVAPCVELPAVGRIEDLASGRAWSLLADAQDAVAACRRDTPCCYTCTVSLAESGRRPLAFAAEGALVVLRARARALLGARA